MHINIFNNEVLVNKPCNLKIILESYFNIFVFVFIFNIMV